MKLNSCIQKINNKQWRKYNIRYWFKDPFWGTLDYLTHYSLRYLSITTNAKVGQFLGPFAAKHRFKAADQRVKNNLAILRPDLDESARNTICHKMWQNIAQSMCEYSLLDKLINEAQVRVENRHYVEEAARNKQAVIFVSAHTGNWELRSKDLINLGFNPRFLYKPVRNRFALKIAINARTRMMDKSHLLEASPYAMRTMCEHLANKHALWIAIDEYKDSQVLFPRLGRDLPIENTNVSYTVRLAQRYNATIIPIWTKREQDLSFSIKVSKPFKVAKGEQEKQQALVKLDHLLEEWVMDNLEQWYMLHQLRL